MIFRGTAGTGRTLEKESKFLEMVFEIHLGWCLVMDIKWMHSKELALE